MTKKYGWDKIFDLKNETIEKVDLVGSRDQAILDSLIGYAKPQSQQNLTEVKIEHISRKTNVVFAMLPEWAPFFPPYNMARLVAIAKEAGYKTRAFDFNSKIYKEISKSKKLDFDPWAGPSAWMWELDAYMIHMHQHIEHLLARYVDVILAEEPDVVGFTLYYCNEGPTKWMVDELKKRKPDLLIMVGGPQCHSSDWRPYEKYDYTVTGEGEQQVIEILEEIESGNRSAERVWKKQEAGQRLSLDNLPPADYTFVDYADYDIPNGVTMEFSRGCTAKCVFCTETHFWKYRGRMALNVIDEVRKLYVENGVNVFWFLDSLVNGNINELRAFCKGIIASGMKIHWTGYARCNGKMDLDYYKDLAAAGCINLCYGIESGSDKVLRDMDKGITIAEAEQNLRLGAQVGIEAFSTWLVGFPTEEPQDFYETITFLWRNRNNNLTAIGGGATCGIMPDSIMGMAPEKYNIMPVEFENNWITNDFTNSKIHRMIRLKAFNITVNNLVFNTNFNLSERRLDGHYDLAFHNPAVIKEVEFEKFDFNICKTDNRFAESIANEIWPLLRLLWRTRGSFSFTLRCSPELDYKQFGSWLSGSNFTANIQFDIDENGKWDANFSFKFIQRDNYPWTFRDTSGGTSVAADRARKLASSSRLSTSGRIVPTWQSVEPLIAKLLENNMSYEYNYADSGLWTTV